MYVYVLSFSPFYGFGKNVLHLNLKKDCICIRRCYCICRQPGFKSFGSFLMSGEYNDLPQKLLIAYLTTLSIETLLQQCNKGNYGVCTVASYHALIDIASSKHAC